MNLTLAWQWAAHAAVASASAIIVARILAGRWLRRVTASVQQLHRIARLLDTASPGGLADLEDAIRDGPAR